MTEYMTWYGNPFTKKDGALMLMLALIYMPMHEFGHWIAYWIFGIPAEFGIIFEPFIAFTVRPLTEPDFAIRVFASFFGGGFTFIVAGIIAIKSRPALLIMVLGLTAGITEVSFFLISGIYDVHFHLLVHSNMVLYVALQTVPVLVVAVFGVPEFRRWLKSMCTRYKHYRYT